MSAARTALCLAALATVLVLAAPAQAGNPELGRMKATDCVACHGEDGLGTAPNFPVLAGQYADYLVRALKQYRSGERNNAVMAPWAANLSDADIADLAAHFSSLPGLSVPKH